MTGGDDVSPVDSLTERMARPGFWESVDRCPIVEETADPGTRRVTFLWRAEKGGALVLLHTLTDRARWEGDLSGHLMERVPGTDVLYRSYELGSDLRVSYQILPCDEPPGTDRDTWRRVLDEALPDPRNPAVLPGQHGRPPSSLLELPDAPAQPYVAERPGVPRGTVHEHVLDGRRVWVHTPAAGAGPYPVLVLLDGDVWKDMAPTTMDNLVADRVVPPMVVVMPDAVDRDTRHAELACHEPFVRFLADRLLPWAQAEHGVTADPARTIIAGQSFGGLTASFAAFLAPERFGNVLSQSGSYWWSDDDPEWLTRRYAAAERRPVRFYLEAGRLEWLLLDENRRFAATLRDKGYDITFREFHGGHDYACWRGGLADGLIHLTRAWGRDG
ncbi:enterochelin esterase [Thermopolyspora flexuosa]|uniref:enterochelin esterase n=1 Tax=Thermopolyspora flexuosa TaxID=103836 RepID=UPI00114EAC0E|nr:enterochelin esterase [Thermopolyspora flexuosa]